MIRISRDRQKYSFHPKFVGTKADDAFLLFFNLPVAEQSSVEHVKCGPRLLTSSGQAHCPPGFACRLLLRLLESSRRQFPQSSGHRKWRDCCPRCRNCTPRWSHSPVASGSSHCGEAVVAVQFREKSPAWSALNTSCTSCTNRSACSSVGPPILLSFAAHGLYTRPCHCLKG